MLRRPDSSLHGHESTLSPNYEELLEFHVKVQPGGEGAIADSETPCGTGERDGHLVGGARPDAQPSRSVSFPPAMVYETSAENSPMMPRLNFNALASNIAEHFQNALPAKLNGLPPIKNPMPLQTEQDMSSSPSELYHDQVNGGEAVTTDVSIEKTFLHMQIRKVQRRYGGKVKETSAARSIWFLAFLSIFTGCGILSYSNSGDSIYNLQLIFISPTAVQESWSVILFIVVTMLTLYVGTYSALVVRIVILWGALAVTVMVLILRKPLTSIALVGNSCPSEAYIGTEACPTRALPCEIRLNGTSTCVATETTQVQQIILFVLLSFEAFTLVLWFYSHHLYTYLVKTNHLTAKGWWKLRAYPNYPNTYTFWTFSEFPYLCRTKHTCQYRGDLNNGGRPHGWGQWIDDSRNGERLNGWWDDGIPLGPFVSREFRSGYGFTCVRVGFALCRLDEWHRSSFIPRCGALRVGIAAVECSTSGRFFRYFPSSRIVFPEVPVEPSTIPVPEGSGTWVNALLQHMNHYKDRDTVDSVVVRAEDRRTLFISGHYPASPDAERHTTISVVPTGRVGASDPETPQGPQEGTLRINGWLPLHLRAEFAVLLYFPGYNNSCQDSCESFAQLLTLGDFPAHLTPWVFSYPAGQILSYFKAKAQAEDPRTTDYIRQLLLAFREAGCRQIHVMSHSMGATAWLASVPRVVDVFSPTGMQLATCTLLNPDFPRDRFRTECFAALRTACSCITMYADARDGALRWSERLNRHGRCLMRPEPSLGLAVFTLCDPLPPDAPEVPAATNPFLDRRAWLDMDVVDTTWIENNVQAIRHSYWNLNRELVEDLRELVLTHRRARFRSRVALRLGNVYSFLAAPSCVKNS